MARVGQIGLSIVINTAEGGKPVPQWALAPSDRPRHFTFELQ